MNNLSHHLVTFIFIFIQVIQISVSSTNAGPVTFQDRINVAAAVASGAATIDATPADIGDALNCFDGKVNTIMRSANINPAYVQVIFDDPVSVRKIRVLLGEPGYPDLDKNTWWLEIADNQEDLSAKSGSYQMIVHRRDDVNGIWDQISLPVPVEAKIWKFNIERTAGDNYVHIPELQLWSDENNVLPSEFVEVDPFMAKPAEGAANVIPVLEIRYLPTKDGINIDVSKVPDFWWTGEYTLAEVKNRINLFNKRIKFMLEEGSKYHGYDTPESQPMMGYKVVKTITVYAQTPAGKIAFYDKNGHPVYLPDYHQIFEKLDVEHYVNDLGVMHIWFWDSNFDSGFPIYNPDIHDPADFRGPPESKMSSTLSGDISNSYRDDSDLPIYDHTYIVFGNNYRRRQNEAVGHNYGHQFELMLKHIDKLDNGKEDLFWPKFVGADENLQSVTGRVGWNHMPPNTTINYDYLNPTLVESDIEDWKPDNSGEKKLVNVDTWKNLNYPWPEDIRINDINERTVSQWHMYWMQAIPGADAKIPYLEDQEISNWWNLIANWDESILKRKLLYKPKENLSEVKIQLKGSEAEGVFAHFKVLVNQSTIGQAYSTRENKEYIFKTNILPKDVETVMVQFDNDKNTISGDRNIYLNKLVINEGNPPYEAVFVRPFENAETGEAVYDRYHLDGKDVIPAQREMYWPGTMIFKPKWHSTTTSINIQLKGTELLGRFAEFMVMVNGSKIGQSYSSAQWQEYTFTADIKPEQLENVAVRFLNDQNFPEGDRNLFLKKLTINEGIPNFEAQFVEPFNDLAQGTVIYDLGLTDGVNVIPGQQAMYWEGTMHFYPFWTGTNPYSKIRINLKGSQAEGKFAHFKVFLNGTTIGDALSSEVYKDYVFLAQIEAKEIDKLMIRFDNDKDLPEGDRNLYLNKVVINEDNPEFEASFMQPFENNESGEVTYDIGALDGVNVIAGQKIMPWNGTMIFDLVDPGYFYSTSEIKLDLYPNPVSSIINLNLQLPAHKPYGLFLYDFDGTLKWTKEGNGSLYQQLSLISFEAGWYSIVVDTGDDHVWKRFLIVK